MELTISVCIPCIQEHIYLLKRCVKSIYMQTLLPMEVVISISNITETCHFTENCNFTKTNNIFINTSQYVESLIGVYRDKLNIIILYTSEKKYAGENRNIAIKNSTGDIISFIDADDVMYSNRLNIIETLFRVCTQCICVLHHFSENALDQIEPDQLFNDNSIVDYNFSELIHFGHPSFRKCIFKKYLYSNLPRTQDLDFIQSIIQEYRQNILIYEQKLTCYVSNDSTFLNK
jgi:glycosyltransferase involved in cell wall biosynthesis